VPKPNSMIDPEAGPAGEERERVRSERGGSLESGARGACFLLPRKRALFACLKKPFAATANILGLTKTITPRAMRYTFNDLARSAGVESLVTKSISGHQTDRMKEHHSTVAAHEQRNLGSDTPVSFAAR
jgi:integrase